MSSVETQKDQKSEWISLGSDCTVGFFLRDNHLRTCAYPFDWVMTPHSFLSSIFAPGWEIKKWMPREIKDTPAEETKWLSKLGFRNNEYAVVFVHEPKTEEVYERRFERLFKMFDQSVRTVKFIRMAHKEWHHEEHPEIATNDAQDMIDFAAWLHRRNPLLKFKIHVLASCRLCDSSYAHQRASLELPLSLPETVSRPPTASHFIKWHAVSVPDGPCATRPQRSKINDALDHVLKEICQI